MSYPKYVVVEDYAATLKAEAVARRKRLGMGVSPPVVRRETVRGLVLAPPPPVEPEDDAVHIRQPATSPPVDDAGFRIGKLPMSESAVAHIVQAVAAAGVGIEWTGPFKGTRNKASMLHKASIYIAHRGIQRASTLWLGRTFRSDHSTIHRTLKSVAANIDHFAPLITAACHRIQWR